MFVCAVVIFCLLGLTSGQPAPYFSKLQDGGVRVWVQGFPGLTKATLTINSREKPYTAYLTKTAGGDWQANIPDVTDSDDDTLKYVIYYEGTGFGHEMRGSANLAHQGRVVRAPITRRYLERRATTVMHDDFSSGRIDPTKWQHRVTASGGGNNEFNMYTPEAANSYVKNNMLYIRPTLTVDRFGNDYLTNGVFDAAATWGECTSQWYNECHREGRGQIPPVMSALLKSTGHIRYGRVLVDARLPSGDWLWPAIWLLPTETQYGIWPRSGELDIMEARGNENIQNQWTHQSLGTDYTHAAIHYGSHWEGSNHRQHEGEFRLSGTTFARSFHTYWLDWTSAYIRMGVDDHTVLAWDTPNEGYWREGGFSGNNIWANGGTDAPFDRPFYLILNVAVGGAWFWDGMDNSPYARPWQTGSSQAEQYMQFWEARHLWEPTWHGEDVAMKVRSVTLEQY